MFYHALIAICLRIAFYYQLSTMATLSYSDVWPTNTGETIVLLIAIFVAGAWFAAMAGAMETAVHHADADELRVQRQASELRAFFRSRRLPASLRERASLYLELLRSRASKGVDEKAVLGWLPANMQLDIAQFVHRDLIERVPIFRECSRGFVKSMAALLRRVSGDGCRGVIIGTNLQQNRLNHHGVFYRTQLVRVEYDMFTMHQEKCETLVFTSIMNAHG